MLPQGLETGDNTLRLVEVTLARGKDQLWRFDKRGPFRRRHKSHEGNAISSVGPKRKKPAKGLPSASHSARPESGTGTQRQRGGLDVGRANGQTRKERKPGPTERGVHACSTRNAMRCQQREKPKQKTTCTTMWGVRRIRATGWTARESDNSALVGKKRRTQLGGSSAIKTNYTPREGVLGNLTGTVAQTSLPPQRGYRERAHDSIVPVPIFESRRTLPSRSGSRSPFPNEPYLLPSSQWNDRSLPEVSVLNEKAVETPERTWAAHHLPPQGCLIVLLG